MATGKKYNTAKEKVDINKLYSVDESLGLIAETKVAKFDETVELAIKLGIDPRQANQQLRGAKVLPHGVGKEIKVLVFAKGEKVKEAHDAGADFVGSDDLVEKIQKENWFDFDVAVATPDVMSTVGKLGKILGPRGLMPSPKVGTVTFEVQKAVQDSKAGRIEIKNDKGGVVHAPFGKSSFDSAQLKANFLSLMDTIIKMKPSASKGVYLKKIVISNTMGPGIKVDINDIKEQIKTFDFAA
ncbi:MAG: 50S ribosomal protein L1 [Candidatus Dadabacteria bacterium]|nr:50S ribosomal protein L1 [Candidatus Dadabacteria bacterium]NIS07789.1 50S ribosomal protein L1 [Candidatus Dadabacteria bacterium]NIY21411.1 50S ribosomal protein L1 [Candidatus Dadabacteria bacterium]